MARKKSTLEAALFISGRELTTQELCRILRTTPEIVDSMVAELMADYEKRGGPIRILKLGDGYKMDVDNTYLGKVRRLAKEAELSRGLLKTLSYIAYKQPVKQSEVVRVIGNRTYDYIKELKEKNFVRSEPKGRTRLLSITEKFTAYFGANAEVLNEPVEAVQARIRQKEEELAKAEEAAAEKEEAGDGALAEKEETTGKAKKNPGWRAEKREADEKAEKRPGARAEEGESTEKMAGARAEKLEASENAEKDKITLAEKEPNAQAEKGTQEKKQQ